MLLSRFMTQMSCDPFSDLRPSWDSRGWFGRDLTRRQGRVLSRPRLPRPFVDANILLGRRVPGEVFVHAVAHERLPGSLIAESLQRLFNGQQKSLAAVIGELEAGSLAGARIPGFNGVVESASGTHDGNGSVFETVNLIQAARLVFRRHEEHVTAGFNFVRNRIVISDLDRDLL